jgi:16S rRNA (adenine1518-N6/adenine1519-N6)-dimethyltransferase
MMWAKKSLGQNFLISPRIVDMIVSAGEIEKGEIVLEIGPGKGTLTAALLRAGAHVKAVEKDDRLIPVLERMFAEEIKKGSLEIIHGDVLEMTPKDLASLESSAYKVIANIPYYITGQIVRTFLSMNRKPSLMVLMVQKEVADRIIARDGKESILSLSVKAYAKPELVVNVARGNFFPIPNVDSAVIKLSAINSPFKNAAEESRFFEIVKAGFAQKRKKLIKNLEAAAEKTALAKAFADMNTSENARAEDMRLEDWLTLTKKLD